MIPAHGYAARFKIDQPNGRHYHNNRPVIAWGDDGEALVLDTKTGRLVPASSYRNFAGIVEVRAPIVAAVPAQGWSAVFREADGSLITDPLVAWTIDADGTAAPVGTSRDGLSDDPTTIGNFVQLLAPGEQPEGADDE